uniref:Ribonuclease VapC n=1 Tax=Thermofilum pendens TaxID=2269 RepID=A0A7J3X4I1_THEPE
MLIETDVLLAHVKEEDWLKPYAEAILRAADAGRLTLYASCEVLHELYYVAVKLGVDREEMLSRVAELTHIANIVWIPATVDIFLAAMALMLEYNMSSVFDAYYAATALLADPDRAVVSTDHVYERIPGIRRVDPRRLAETLLE